MKSLTYLVIAALTTLPCLTAAQQNRAYNPFSWKYYRPSNTGIQGDDCKALYIGADGNPWIAGYDASFGEGGLAKFIQNENRWINISNVDYPEIGHPERSWVERVNDIEVDSSGAFWMATARGGLYFNPNLGPKSIRRYGDDNCGIHAGWSRSCEIAPDGSIWFASYGSFYGAGGIDRFRPTTNVWTPFEMSFCDGSLTIQPKPSSGYYVWTNETELQVARFDSATGAWSSIPVTNGNPAKVLRNHATDSAGNTWMMKWTNATLFESQLDLRRANGTWANLPAPPFGTGVDAVRTLGPEKALFADGNNGIWRYQNGTYTFLGTWAPGYNTYDVGQDAAGNVWACGIGGAARRDAITGIWQRYRITNTSQYDFFNNDLTVLANGQVMACANAAPGYGGLTKFDGTTWTGVNNHTYGLGTEWPFNSDNGNRVYLRPSNGMAIVNPMFGGVFEFDGETFSPANFFNRDTVSDFLEDSTNRLWGAVPGILAYRSGNNWIQVNDIGAKRLMKDPNRAGTIWALTDYDIVRTDGTTLFQRSLNDFPELDPQSDQFKGMAIDKNGIVWIGANTINLPNNSTLIRLDPSNGTYKTYRFGINWPFPGEYLMPLGATPDGKVWMQYDSDFLTAQRGLCWFDETRIGVFPAPPFGDPQWGGLPHAGIADFEVRLLPTGYELWMSCMSRGIAVLRYRQLGITTR